MCRSGIDCSASYAGSAQRFARLAVRFLLVAALCNPASAATAVFHPRPPPPPAPLWQALVIRSGLPVAATRSIISNSNKPMTTAYQQHE